MSPIKKMDNLKVKDKKEVCVATIYNILGWFLGSTDDATITKGVFNELLKANIKDVTNE